RHGHEITQAPAGEDLQQENKRLKRELAEAKRANEILKAASAFFAAELDAPRRDDRVHRRTPRSVRGRGHLPHPWCDGMWVHRHGHEITQAPAGEDLQQENKRLKRELAEAKRA
ncbi:hypothetical protein EDM40_15095, partial [Staphylococcus aureus]